MGKMKKIMQFCLALILGLVLATAPAPASQNSVVVPDGTGLAVRTKINNALNTLVTLNSGSGEPSTKYAYMLWADTTAAKLKIRNSTNDGWIIIGDLSLDRLGQAQVSSLQYSSYISGASTTGNDSYVITLSPAPGTLVNGMQVILLPDVPNTGTASLNLNGLGAKTIKKGSDGALVNLNDNDILPNVPAVLVYSLPSTTWVYVNPPAITPPPPPDPGGLQSVRVFTANGTWNKPTGITKVVVVVVGGGGGGRSVVVSGYVAGGGGGGGASIKLIDVSAISSVAVTVGPGGGPTYDGGTSSFGSHCSATGGLQGWTSTTFTTRVEGGVGSNGDINLAGEVGGMGFIFDQAGVAAGLGGDGGGSLYGQGGKGGGCLMTTYNNGYGGKEYGGGGGGAVNQDGIGGSGRNGIVIVWEYK